MRSKETKYVGKFEKNQGFERVLDGINSELKVFHDSLLETLENQKNIHVIGVPRSGTTLLMQLMISHFDLGYINNLSATFWNTPIIGIELAKKLLGESYLSSLNSEFGRTSSIQEPHEFGYFWNSILKYPELKDMGKGHEKNVDWITLNKLINNMCKTYGKPMVFKSFLLGFHSSTYFKQNSESRFIYIKRDPIENAHSILKLRRELLGDENLWGSIKPQQYEELKNRNKFEQIAGQVLFLDKKYQQLLEEVPETHKVILNYEDLCFDPGVVFDEISNKFNLKLKFKIEAEKINSKSHLGSFTSEFKNAFDQIKRDYNV